MTLEVLDEKLDGLIELLAEKERTNIKNHETILAQVTKTNGRVTQLEKWRYTIAGGFLVVTFLLSFLSFKVVFSVGF